MKSPQRNIDTVKSIYLSPNYKLHNEELRRRSISPQHPYRNEGIMSIYIHINIYI